MIRLIESMVERMEAAYCCIVGKGVYVTYRKMPAAFTQLKSKMNVSLFSSEPKIPNCPPLGQEQTP